jgi:hypothetical protein
MCFEIREAETTKSLYRADTVEGTYLNALQSN